MSGVEIKVEPRTSRARRTIQLLKGQMLLLRLSGHLGPIVAAVLAGTIMLVINLAADESLVRTLFDVAGFGMAAYYGGRAVYRFQRLERNVDHLLRQRRGPIDLDTIKVTLGRDVLEQLRRHEQAGGR